METCARVKFYLTQRSPRCENAITYKIPEYTEYQNWRRRSESWFTISRISSLQRINVHVCNLLSPEYTHAQPRFEGCTSRCTRSFAKKSRCALAESTFVGFSRKNLQMPDKIQKISGGTSKGVGSQFTDERKERKRPEDQRSSRERYLDRCTWRIQINRQIPTYRAPHSSNLGKSANAEWRGVKKKNEKKKQNKNLCPPGRFTRAQGEKLTPRNFAARRFKYREYHANIRSLKT